MLLPILRKSRALALAPRSLGTRTLRFRRHLLDLGLGIAEAMDTAQRGGRADWDGALELIRTSLSRCERSERDRIFSGAEPTIWTAGCANLRRRGWSLPRADRSGSKARRTVDPDGEPRSGAREDAGRLCDRLSQGAVGLRPARYPHWLGDMFDPDLRGYWGANRSRSAAETALAVIGRERPESRRHQDFASRRGKEIAMRRRLPDGVKMYTGDDFNYPELIKGDERGFSHALLGIFDPIAPAASAALTALAKETALR